MAETAQTLLTLVSLPIEIITEVLKLISWKDVLHIRLVYLLYHSMLIHLTVDGLSLDL